jgi:hypothetical protein
MHNDLIFFITYYEVISATFHYSAMYALTTVDGTHYHFLVLRLFTLGHETSVISIIATDFIMTDDPKTPEELVMSTIRFTFICFKLIAVGISWLHFFGLYTRPKNIEFF